MYNNIYNVLEQLRSVFAVFPGLSYNSVGFIQVKIDVHTVGRFPRVLRRIDGFNDSFANRLCELFQHYFQEYVHRRLKRLTNKYKI